MGFFKRHTNKKFSYTPRYLDSDSNSIEIKHKFDEYRTTIEKTNLKGKLTNAMEDYRTSDQSVKRRIYIIVGILILIFLMIIEFDLSIFLPKG